MKNSNDNSTNNSDQSPAATSGISRRAFAMSSLAGMPLVVPAFRSWKDFFKTAPVEQRIIDKANGELPLGPYVRDGTPWRAALAELSEPGRALTVRGRILGADTSAPLCDVLINVWQADANGEYDFSSPTEAATPSSYRMRGLMLSDAAGRYAFSSIVPGNRNAGNELKRAKHVHYLVQRAGYEPLMTNMFFAGDVWTESDVQVRQSLTASLESVAVNHSAALFDIALRPSKPVDAKAYRTFGEYFGTYQLVSGSRNIVAVEWRSNRLVAIEESNVVPLVHQRDSQFSAGIIARSLTFVRNHDGQIVAMMSEQANGQRGKLNRVA